MLGVGSRTAGLSLEGCPAEASERMPQGTSLVEESGISLGARWDQRGVRGRQGLREWGVGAAHAPPVLGWETPTK